MSFRLRLFLVSLALLASLAMAGQVLLRSKLNTDQQYRSPNVPSTDLYSIGVTRTQSSLESQSSKCRAVNKYIEVARQTELFRLSKSDGLNRQEKVYEKLTSLNQQENIIEEFQIIADHIFLITTQGDGYFLSLKNHTDVQRVRTNFFQSKNNGQFADLIVIKDYKERVLVVSRNKVVLCRPGKQECEEVDGYQKAENFRGAELYQDNGRYFLFIIQIHSIAVYELTANSKLKNKRTLDSAFFGIEQISIRAIYRTQANKFLVLDDLQGIREISSQGGLQSLKTGSRLVYEQYGCYQIVGQEKGETLALACAPSLNTYFILKLVKSHQFAEFHYQPLETVFLHEKLYQIDYTENLLLSRVFSGVKLYWSSRQIGNPYPHFYRGAGDLFLHNAIQAKLKIVQNVKTIFMAAEDELLVYELSTVDPYVTCSSGKQVTEQYKVTYYFPCKEQAFMHQENICSSEQVLSFQAWQHKQLKVLSHLVPFLLSLLGVIAVVYTVVRIYRKYVGDVQLAKVKYNIQDNQIDS